MYQNELKARQPRNNSHSRTLDPMMRLNSTMIFRERMNQLSTLAAGMLLGVIATAVWMTL